MSCKVCKQKNCSRDKKYKNYLDQPIPECADIDGRLLELISQDQLRKITLEEYKNYSNNVFKNYLKLSEGKALSGWFPHDADSFFKLIKYVHLKLFHDSGQTLFGDFRTDDIIVDEGKNLFSGAAPGAIVERIDQLWADIEYRLKASLAQDRLARVIGDFMVDFLEIHPFRDGNGRVCRIICSIIAAENSFSLNFSIMEDRGEYLQSLREARKRKKKFQEQDEVRFSTRAEQNKRVYSYISSILSVDDAKEDEEPPGS